jgi:hypothetical protein
LICHIFPPKCFLTNIYIFSATLSFALLERGFTSSSSLDGNIGFLVITLTVGFFPQTHTGKFLGQVQPLAKSA